MTAKKYNIAKENHFSVVFNRIPELSELIKEFPLPELSVDNSKASYQGMMIPTGGSAAQFSNIVIKFRIDESHEIINKIYDWALSTQINDEVNTTLNNKLEKLKEDITLIINDNNNNPTTTYKFVGCVPVNVSINPMLRGESKDLEGSLTLEFDYFKLDE